MAAAGLRPGARLQTAGSRIRPTAETRKAAVNHTTCRGLPAEVADRRPPTEPTIPSNAATRQGSWDAAYE